MDRVNSNGFYNSAMALIASYMLLGAFFCGLVALALLALSIWGMYQ